ncbi:hypothetical protein ACOMHN_056309 [Nucella lapillus]
MNSVEEQVLCVDQGVVVEAGKERVRNLPPRLMDTPAQAMLCCLADVVPVDSHWCDAALSLFTDFISIGPLKLTAYGLCEEGKAHRVTLCDESQAEGSLTISVVGVESSINRTLVELGYAEAVAGSPLEVALQVERTINDSDKIEQMDSLPIQTQMGKLASLFEDSLPIQTQMGKLASLFEDSLPIQTQMGKLASLFEDSLPIQTQMGKLASLFEDSLPIQTQMGKLASLFEDSLPIQTQICCILEDGYRDVPLYIENG